MKDNEEIKQTKMFLRRYKVNQQKIQRLQDKIEWLDDKLMNFHAIRYDGEPKGTTTISKEDIISDKIDYEERIERLKIKSRELKKEICKVIDELDDTRHIEVLELYFIECMSFHEIADKMKYTLRHTISLYSRAITLIKIESTS